ncbi:MAG: BamA/TamA family outer membrane protein [Planctomycetota bacterium]
MISRNTLFHYLQAPETNERMKKLHPAGIDRTIGWLVIAGLLFSASGCITPWGKPPAFPGFPPNGAQPTTTATGVSANGVPANSTANNRSPNNINLTPPGSQSAAASGPTYAALAENTISQAGGFVGDSGPVQQAVGDQPAGQIPMNGVRQASDSRYTVRQVPQGFGPPLPQSNDYTQPQANSLGGTGLVDPYAPVPVIPPMPRVREADLELNGFPARTGRIILGGAVNSDAGLTGNLTVDERNFDITRWPRSFRDLFGGTAFRGAGQTFRLEAAPGTDFKRYTLQFADPNIFGYKPVSVSVSGFLFDRRFNDWDEERLGGRVAFGYRVTPDLSVAFGVSGQNVNISNARVLGVPELDEVIGDNELWTGEVTLNHDTRDTPLQASRGHFFEFKFEEAFGDFNYARFELEYRKYWLVAERADRTGRQTISYSTQVGFSGEETPIFENFFAGGYATLRGFDFRGASPVVSGVEVGGRFQWLNSVEYMFPITADDAFRGVAFVDFGTVEQDIEIDADNFRVAPGLGLRVAIPMLGPAPLAFDFAYPLSEADTDDRRIFSFYMSLIN